MKARDPAGHTPCKPFLLSSGSTTRWSREDALLICRCAWHQRYCGYPLLNGVVSWRGWSLRFTDGICESCLERFRTEHRSFLERRRTPDGRAVTSLAEVAVPSVSSSNEAA